MRFKLISALCLFFLFCAAFAQAQEKEDIQAIPLGDLEVMAITDATAESLPGLIPQLSQYPEFSGLYSRGPLQGVFRTFFFKDGDHNVLVDAGWGQGYDLKGNTLAILKREGINPDAITDILITHMDWDHIGGLLQDGKPVYPNATLWLSRPEYEAWVATEIHRRPDHAKALAKEVAKAYDGRIKLFNFGDTILPMVATIDASGHTPGMAAYEIGSGDNKLIIAGDLIHVGEVQLQRPDLSSVYDIYPDQAARARERILAKAANEKSELAGMHLKPISPVIKRPDGGYAMREPR